MNNNFLPTGRRHFLKSAAALTGGLDCKCFHVCGHESHHPGQIAMLKSRVPGVNPGNNAG
jgi:hypothetical protein